MSISVHNMIFIDISNESVDLCVNLQSFEWKIDLTDYVVKTFFLYFDFSILQGRFF